VHVNWLNRQALLALGILFLTAMVASALAQDSPGNDGSSSFEAILQDLQDQQGTDDYDAYLDEPIEYVDENALTAAHEAYLDTPGLQLERPENAPPPPTEYEPRDPPAWLRAIAGFIEALGPLWMIIFYGAIVVIILGFLWFLFGEAARMRFGGSGKEKDIKADDELHDLRPDAAAARSLLEEADALAHRGQFAEAVHLLLFRSIEDIQTRLDGGVPKSMTAREIGGLGKLPDRARGALSPIIGIVERSYFGGRDVDEPGWKDARQSYEDFAFGTGW
jgi:hypothetical protein